MRQWRRRTRNAWSRSGGRRYADSLPDAISRALDAVVAYQEERERLESGASSEVRVRRREEALADAIERLTQAVMV